MSSTALLLASNFRLENLNSSNGTFVKANADPSFAKVGDAHIASGSQVKVGDTVFTVSMPQQQQENVTCNKCGANIAPQQYASGQASFWEGKLLCSKCRGNGEIAAGKKFGAFEVVRKLGGGGMGMVYLVRELKTGYHYAIKVARPNIAVQEGQRQPSYAKPPAVYRCATKIYCATTRQDTLPPVFFYIPMEYVEGIVVIWGFAKK